MHTNSTGLAHKQAGGPLKRGQESSAALFTEGEKWHCFKGWRLSCKLRMLYNHAWRLSSGTISAAWEKKYTFQIKSDLILMWTENKSVDLMQVWRSISLFIQYTQIINAVFSSALCQSCASADKVPSFLFCPAVSINTTRKRSSLRSFSTAVQSADTRAPEFITYLPCDVNAAPGGLMSVAPVQARVSLQTTGAASWLSPGISQARRSSWLSAFLNADGHRRRLTKGLFFFFFF